MVSSLWTTGTRWILTDTWFRPHSQISHTQSLNAQNYEKKLLALNNLLMLHENRPFRNYLWSLFQNKSWYSSMYNYLVFICSWMKTDFHVKGLASGLTLKQRLKAIRKWRIKLAVTFKAAKVRSLETKQVPER